MNGMADHAKPASRRDRPWVLLALSLIVACGLLEVWASWLAIGAVSGFPRLGPMTTGWILPVTTEAYWTVALLAWLVDPAGPRSCRFAMHTAVVVFGLSLTGQEFSHVLAARHALPPTLAVMFVTALPLVSVALGALLIHLRSLDREEAADAAEARELAARQAATDAAEADENAALRAELEAAQARHQAASEAARRESDAAVGELAAELETAREAARQEAALRPAIEADRNSARTELAALRESLDLAQAHGREARHAGDSALANANRQLDALRTSLEVARREASRRPALEAEAEAARTRLGTERTAREIAEAARTEAEDRAARAEHEAARLARKLAASAGAVGARKADETAVPNAVGDRAAARKLAGEILDERPDTSGAQLAKECGMSEKWGQNFRKAWFEERPEAV